jgi:hypothetical protein
MKDGRSGFWGPYHKTRPAPSVTDVMLMSALGHKRTLAGQHIMSALSSKADMCSATWNVCFVPIADMTELGAQTERPHRGGLSEIQPGI